MRCIAVRKKSIGCIELRTVCSAIENYPFHPVPISPVWPHQWVDVARQNAYHFGMPNVLHWTLVFTASSLEHLAERDIAAEDVADVVFGRYGTARVRKGRRGRRLRWFVVAPLEGGELLACVLREATPRDVAAEGAFVVPANGIAQEPGEFKTSMHLCVSARLADADEVRSYRAWRRSKGGS
jgi:hypothetical protein